MVYRVYLYEGPCMATKQTMPCPKLHPMRRDASISPPAHSKNDGPLAPLSAENLELLLQRRERLLTSLSSTSAKHELSVQLPFLGELPGFSDFGVHERIVVLEVGAETFGLESDPQGVLQHAARLRGPDGEAVGVDGELGLHALDNGLIFEEEDLMGVLVSLLPPEGEEEEYVRSRQLP